MFEKMVASSTRLTLIKTPRTCRERIIIYFVLSILRCCNHPSPTSSCTASISPPSTSCPKHKNAIVPGGRRNGYHCNLKSMILDAVLPHAARQCTARQLKRYSFSSSGPLSCCNAFPVLPVVHETICLCISREAAVVYGHVSSREWKS